MKGLDYTALTVAIIGAVNWGLIGFFRLDLVALVFGNMTWLSRIIYAVVGICGLYLISVYKVLHLDRMVLRIVYSIIRSYFYCFLSIGCCDCQFS